MPVSSTPDELPTSVLTLSGMGVPPYSARGLTQSLEPISEASQLRRTVNGSLKDVSFASFQKYKSTITGTDQQPPACDGLWPGREVIVDCVAELAFETASFTPQRTIVVGSDYQDGDFTFYRPQLTMRVMNFAIAKDEYGATNGWTLELEEV